MKTVYKHYGNVYAGFLQKHYPNLYLEGSWLNGGDWDAALRVLVFTPERMRLRTYWEALRSCHQDTFLTGKRRTSYPKIRPQTLRCTVLRSSTHIGSSATALIAAGLEVPAARMMAVAEFYGYCVMLWNSIRRMIFQRN